MSISARLIARTVPEVDSGIPTSEDLISYCARVSNGGNQDNYDTSERLLKYCIKHQHWSIFEMSNAVVEVVAPRDITRQLIRHHSFRFQEFSQRYAYVDSTCQREMRLQDYNNRQSSHEITDNFLKAECEWDIAEHRARSMALYNNLIAKGIAKETARVVLPEGLTLSRLYVNGTLRSWIHYLQLRLGNGTQKEHQELALRIYSVLREPFAMTFRAVGWDEKY